MMDLFCIFQNDRKITFDNPTFNIEVIKTEKSKQKCIWVDDVFNPCSSVRLKVFGKKKTVQQNLRKTIFSQIPDIFGHLVAVHVLYGN